MPTTLLSEAEREASLTDLDGWSLVDGRDAIYSKYVFESFIEAFAFMTKCALESEKMDHHPEWTNVYKTVEVTLWTHEVNGLSEKDITLARIFDACV